MNFGNSSFLHQMTAFGGKWKSDSWNGYHPHPTAESFYLNVPGWNLWWFRSWFTSRSDAHALGAEVSVRGEGKTDRGGHHLKLPDLNLEQFCHTLPLQRNWCCPSSNLRQPQRPEGSWDISMEQVVGNDWTVCDSGSAPLYFVSEKSRLFPRKVVKLNSSIEGKQPCSDFCKGM